MSKQGPKKKEKSASPASPKKANLPGDHIAVEKIGADSAVAAGRNAKAIRIGNITIDLRLLPVVVLLAVIIGVMAYMLVPKRPEKMSHEFNVAIAEFIVVNASGQSVASRDGYNLAAFMYKRLEASFSELDKKTIDYELWPPEYTGVITGGLKEAEALAKRIDADVVIYGVITQAGPDSTFAPEFYVHPQGFEQAEEITGEHKMGSPVFVPLPFETSELQDTKNPALSARANALSQIAIGLAYYSIDNYETAIEYFQRAEATQGWLSSAGKEVVYLLLGNATSRLAARDKTIDCLDTVTNDCPMTAIAFYDQALAINGDYARAAVGRAGVLYLLAIGDPKDPSQPIDQTRLNEAEAEFEKALSYQDAPENANIAIKVNFGLGQIFLVRYLANKDSAWLEQAQTKFESVVQEYDSGNWRIVDIAGHAHARLGKIAMWQNDPATAVEEYTKAIELVTPYYQAYYHTRLGKIYADAQQTEAAIEAYQHAIRISESLGDEAGVEQYSACLKELESSSVVKDCEGR